MSERVLIIAEAGVNHNGSLELAKQLVDKAAEAGADYIKFQTFKASKYKREIDHIFLSNDFILKNKEVVKDIETSDHYPILIDVELERND